MAENSNGSSRGEGNLSSTYQSVDKGGIRESAVLLRLAFEDAAEESKRVNNLKLSSHERKDAALENLIFIKLIARNYWSKFGSIIHDIDSEEKKRLEFAKYLYKTGRINNGNSNINSQPEVKQEEHPMSLNANKVNSLLARTFRRLSDR